MAILAINSKLHARFREQAKAYREWHGWTQSAVAEMLEVKPSVVSQTESGRFCPSADTIEKWADIFGVTWEAFLSLSPQAAYRRVKTPA